MDDPSQIPPSEPIKDASDPSNPESARAVEAEPIISVAAANPIHAEPIYDDGRRQMLRRMRWLMIMAFASFALAGWMIVRYTRLAEFNASAGDQVAIVRAEIEALSRGDLKAGYELLSERYRKEVPFENYHALVSQHRRVFLTRQYRVTRRDELRGQIVIQAQLVTVNGQHYLAKFTLVQAAGKWWIDDLQWAAQSVQVRV
jgi:hypothetical protein